MRRRHLGFARGFVDRSPDPWSKRAISTAHAQGAGAPVSLAAVKPLQAVAMGLVIVLLTASVHSYDLLPDPLGWLLVLAGAAQLPPARRGAVVTPAVVSLVVSGVVWFPGLRHALNVTDDSLAWAAGIPELATTIVLAHALAQAARAAGDREARRWLQTARALLVVVLVLPPVVLGGGLDPLVGALAVVGSLSLLLVIVLLFRYAGRPWALPTQDEAVRRG